MQIVLDNYNLIISLTLGSFIFRLLDYFLLINVSNDVHKNTFIQK